MVYHKKDIQNRTSQLMKIVVFSSSIRKERKSTYIAKALVQSINDNSDHTAELIDLAKVRLPMMEQVERKTKNIPSVVRELGEKLNTADAMIFVTPEYNGSYAPALKNAVDYYSKAYYARKVIGTCAVSAGSFGGMRAALQIQQLILALRGYPNPQMLLVPNVEDALDADGKIINEEVIVSMNKFIKEFLWQAEAIVDKKAVDYDKLK